MSRIGSKHVPAKLVRPELSETYPRERLFNLFDGWRDRRLLWIGSPGGSGKTTAVGSYIEHRNLPNIWYQMDSGDQDLATFFHYLGLAIQGAIPDKEIRMPHLAPENMAGLGTFSRRYFETMFESMPVPFLLVFDNYQHVKDSERIHQVLVNAVESLPPGGQIVIISRSDPPMPFSRLLANRSLVRASWDDMRLTAEEVDGIASQFGLEDFAQDMAKQMEGSLQGWAAGLVLMLEAARTGLMRADDLREVTRETVFNYFAGEIFEQTDSDTKNFLLRTSVLPDMTVDMARSLTSIDNSDQILAQLTRQHYFTTKSPDADPVYQYHPLFREFLLARAKQDLTADDLSSAQRRATEMLWQAGRVEDTAHLMRQTGDWDSLAQLINQQAQTLVAEGRLGTLESWLLALPQEHVENDCWLLFWRASCRLPFDPAEARYYYQSAFNCFQKIQDPVGSYLSWAGAVDTFLYQWGNFRLVDAWIDKLTELRRRYPEYPSLDVEARVVCSMFTALMFRQPHHPDFPRWLRRARNLINIDLNIRHRIMLGNHLVLYYTWWLGKPAKAQVVLDTLRHAASAPTVPALHRIMWYSMEAAHCWTIADNEKMLQFIEDGLKIAAETGVHILDFRLLSHGVLAGVSADDNDIADRFLERLKPMVPTARPLDSAHYHYVAHLAALKRGDVPEARELITTALSVSDDAGVPFAEGIYRIGYGHLLLEQGEIRAGMAELARAQRIAEGMHAVSMLFGCYLYVAEHALNTGHTRLGLLMLRKGLGIGQRMHYWNRPLWRPKVFADLLVHALQAGIETEYCRKFIRRRNLEPSVPPLDVDDWPWAIRIHTLGQFRVMINDELLKVAGKGQRKPLELLKALVAHGGQGVPVEVLSDSVWPDADGDAAQRNLDTTLHRLRKLIGHEKALSLNDGKLSLDPYLCWIDTVSFEQALSDLITELNKNMDDRRNDVIQSLYDRCLYLYQGPFLAREADTDYILARREELERPFLQQLGALGRHWEQQQNWNTAVTVYEKRLAINAVAEEPYQRLIHCYHQLGLLAEARSTYQRCEEAMESLLGVMPSEKTRELAGAI